MDFDKCIFIPLPRKLFAYEGYKKLHKKINPARRKV